ncbi:hypothetical protein N5T66_00465 [Aliarcobacter cryaerophilus]|nr:hypothetical protein [Aliarcobacter cryaerophilus]
MATVRPSRGLIKPNPSILTDKLGYLQSLGKIKLISANAMSKCLSL